jgi:transposase InsO family protein
MLSRCLPNSSTWFADYNRVHPHSALQYRSREMFRQHQRSFNPVRFHKGNYT